MRFNDLYAILTLPLVFAGIALDLYLSFRATDKRGKGKITMRYRQWAFRRFETGLKRGKPKFTLMLIAAEPRFARTSQMLTLWLLSLALTVVPLWLTPWPISYGIPLIILSVDDLLTDTNLRKRFKAQLKRFVWRPRPRPVLQPVKI